jgi:hypothetical protein
MEHDSSLYDPRFSPGGGRFEKCLERGDREKLKTEGFQTKIYGLAK